MEKVPVSYSSEWWLDGDLSLQGKNVKKITLEKSKIPTIVWKLH